MPAALLGVCPGCNNPIGGYNKNWGIPVPSALHLSGFGLVRKSPVE